MLRQCRSARSWVFVKMSSRDFFKVEVVWKSACLEKVHWGLMICQMSMYVLRSNVDGMNGLLLMHSHRYAYPQLYMSRLPSIISS